MEPREDCRVWIGTKNIVKVRKWITTLALLAIIVGVFSSVHPVRSQQTSDMLTGVNYEGPYDWHYGVTDAEIEQDFQLFKENNVDNIIVNIIWSTFQTDVNPANYNNEHIANVKRVLAQAEQYEISVCLSFFQYWMDTTTGVPRWCIDPWTGNRRYIAIVRDRTIRGYFLEMVGDLVDEFKGSSAIKSWSLLNEPMHTGSYNFSQLSTEREEFHLLIEEGCSVIRARDSRPITVRFTLPYSPWHTRTSGAYDTFVDFERVTQSLDFISINTYANPADYGTTRKWQGTTWSEFVQAVQDTKSAGYPFWVSEFGNKKGDGAQRKHYESAIQIFQELGVDACFSWVWVHNDGAEAYNICYGGGLPKPAFYELNLAFQPPPPPPPPTEMTLEDWQRFWMWLKQNPPGWQKTDWGEHLEGQLQYWKAQTGTTEMGAQDWQIFWEWLKQNPPSTIKNTKRWASILEEKLETWKTEYW